MNHKPREIAENVLVLRTLVVNVYVVRTASSWVLVDAGLPGYAEAIRSAAAAFVGSTAPPTAIVLTHGHFDHVGSLEALLVEWPVPVFAHRLEVPYLTGQSAYPPPDPRAERGALSLLSRLYPRGPIDISAQLRALPDNGRVPGMDDWRWVPTPGHSPGHVSFFRDRDRTLLAGDAVTTTRQESIVAVVTQRREVHGPPPYFTIDWPAAADAVGHLAALQPDLLASGHGDPLRGTAMRAALRALASRFDEREVPSFGRYVRQPAITDGRGIVSLPPDPWPRVAAGAAVAAGLACTCAFQRRRKTT